MQLRSNIDVTLLQLSSVLDKDSHFSQVLGCLKGYLKLLKAFKLLVNSESQAFIYYRALGL